MEIIHRVQRSRRTLAESIQNKFAYCCFVWCSMLLQGVSMTNLDKEDSRSSKHKLNFELNSLDCIYPFVMLHPKSFGVESLENPSTLKVHVPLRREYVSYPSELAFSLSLPLSLKRPQNLKYPNALRSSPLSSLCDRASGLFDWRLHIQMARKPAPEIDDELFNEVYGKEYTGPPGLTAKNAEDAVKANKRPASVDANRDSDEEDEPRDPNAVPTDFTSREAKAWEAKAKATERNWKKRKEEEMICKICGVPGHFTQGCPSTLGSNRKSQEFIERVPAREKHVKALFTDKVMHRIENDVGCKLKMEEKFIIVSGKDRLVLRKGVEAVNEVIKEEDKGKKKDSSSSRRIRSRSPDRSPVSSHLRRSESQRSHQSPGNKTQFQTKPFNQEKIVEDDLREDLQQLSRSSAQAYGNDGVKRRSRSPQRSNFTGEGLMSYDGLTQNMGKHKTDNWDSEGHGVDIHSGRKFEIHGYPQTLEELELEFKREAMEIGRVRDKEEDEENFKHRESIREMRETYMKKLSVMRSLHSKQWEEFLQMDVQRRQRAHQHMSASSYNTYSHPGFSDYDSPSGASHYSANNLAVDSRSRYSYPVDNYSAVRPHNSYSEFQRQRHEDFGKPYNRY